MPESLVDAFIPIPDALRHIKDTWLWLDCPSDLFAKSALAFATMSGLTNDSTSLARVHSAVDTGLQTRTWLLRLYSEVVYSGETPIPRAPRDLPGEQYQALMETALAWAKEAPRPQSGLKRSINATPEELSRDSLGRHLKLGGRELGIQVLNPTKRSTQFSTENLWRLREFAADDPASFHLFVYCVCRTGIEKARKNRIPEELEMSPIELGAWWVDGARKLT